MDNARQPLIKLILGLLLVGIGLWIVVDNLPAQRVDPSTIHSYEACVAAGYPNLKTYPGKCILPSGAEFIQSIPVKNFEECAQYYPVMESYPAQCNTPNGEHFVQELLSDTFDPTKSFSLLATTSGGITGKVTTVKVDYSSTGYYATISNYAGDSAGVLSAEDVSAFLAALNQVDFATQPDITGPECCDITITTLSLTQGNHAWEINVNGAVEKPAPLNTLLNVLMTLDVE